MESVGMTCFFVQISQQTTEENASLHIKQAGRQDSGLYTARVQNEFGFELSKFAITVLGQCSSVIDRKAIVKLSY